MMYTMLIEVLTEFQLKITMIGGDIGKKVFLPQIKPMFGASLAQILSKLSKY